MRDLSPTRPAVEALRHAVLESWTFTQQRYEVYARRLKAWEVKVGFTRYEVDDGSAQIRLGPRKYKVLVRSMPEEPQWVPFAVLLDQFEGAVRADERECICGGTHGGDGAHQASG